MLDAMDDAGSVYNEAEGSKLGKKQKYGVNKQKLIDLEWGHGVSDLFWLLQTFIQL